jgi:NAD(P)-dependent dehydrogenase (short-subunit alcohol dehydrogenase family)
LGPETRPLDVLKASALVNVSSAEAERLERLEMNDLQFERRKYHGIAAYEQSKLLMNAFTFELSRRLAGTGVTANCLHPGVVAKNFWAANPAPLIGKLIIAVSRDFLRRWHKSQETSSSPSPPSEFGMLDSIVSAKEACT